MQTVLLWDGYAALWRKTAKLQAYQMLTLDSAFTSEMNYWGQEKKACYMGIYN